jgi:hypothetical protein
LLVNESAGAILFADKGCREKLMAAVTVTGLKHALQLILSAVSKNYVSKFVKSSLRLESAREVPRQDDARPVEIASTISLPYRLPCDCGEEGLESRPIVLTIADH